MCLSISPQSPLFMCSVCQCYSHSGSVVEIESVPTLERASEALTQRQEVKRSFVHALFRTW